MTTEEIEKLGLIISKRLGKKANALWRDAKVDLIIINIIKDHITKICLYSEPQCCITDKDNFNVKTYIDYVLKKTDEEEKTVITNWLKDNIDKESLKRWLEEE